jgi:general secretion pathway protein A
LVHNEGVSYERFFGLHDAPFSLAPDPAYLFESQQHASALQQLSYAIERHEPVIVMTGEIGTGKTLLCRAVLQRFDRQTFVSVINDPLLDRDDLLRRMLEDFGVLSGDRAKIASVGRHELVHALEDFLASLGRLDAHAVVIIDEAQHLQPEVLEQIRLLCNIDTPKGTLLQIVLSGQLDLESLLARPELRQVQQRVSRRIRLEPLSKEELRSYIDHRLAVGRVARSQLPGSGELARALEEWDGHGAGVSFTPDAVEAVWRRSAGLPRVINVLCDRALEEAHRDRVSTVDARLVERAESRLEPAGERLPAPIADGAESPPSSLSPVADALEWGRPATQRRPMRSIASLAGLVIVGGLVGWFAVSGPWRSARAVDRSAPSVVPPRATSPVASPKAATPMPSVTAATPAPAPAEPAPRAAPQAARASLPTTTVPATASGDAFEIVVASFRTEARAAEAMSQVQGAGVPARQRATGGWQQVIAGPFSSREQAEASRARLDRVGFPGTQIIIKP